HKAYLALFASCLWQHGPGMTREVRKEPIHGMCRSDNTEINWLQSTPGVYVSIFTMLCSPTHPTLALAFLSENLPPLQSRSNNPRTVPTSNDIGCQPS